MIAADSSVLIAGFASWHGAHDAARAALARRPRLPAHCTLEAYSVLTRPPSLHRAEPGIARDFIADHVHDDLIVLSPQSHRDFLLRLPDLGIGGGAAYDALIATTVAEAGATLKSCDRRARATYERCRVDFEMIA